MFGDAAWHNRISGFAQATSETPVWGTPAGWVPEVHIPELSGRPCGQDEIFGS